MAEWYDCREGRGGQIIAPPPSRAERIAVAAAQLFAILVVAVLIYTGN